MKVRKAAELLRMKKSFINISEEGTVDPFKGVDIVIKKQNGIIYVIVDQPDGVILPLLESEVGEQFGVQEPTGEQVIFYIWRLAAVAKYSIAESIELDLAPISRYLSINIITGGMALADYFNEEFNLKGVA